MPEKEKKDVRSEILSRSPILSTYLSIDEWIETDPGRFGKELVRVHGNSGAFNFGMHIRFDEHDFTNRGLLGGVLNRESLIRSLWYNTPKGRRIGADPGISPLFYIGYEATSMDDLKIFLPDLLAIFSRRGYFTEDVLKGLSKTPGTNLGCVEKSEQAKQLLLDIMESGFSRRTQEIPFTYPESGLLREFLDEITPPQVPAVFTRSFED